MPTEQILPLVATTITVTLLKILAIAGGVLLIKWLIGKKKRNKQNSIYKVIAIYKKHGISSSRYAVLLCDLPLKPPEQVLFYLAISSII